jgi:hypothetical protein
MDVRRKSAKNQAEFGQKSDKSWMEIKQTLNRYQEGKRTSNKHQTDIRRNSNRCQIEQQNSTMAKQRNGKTTKQNEITK